MCRCGDPGRRNVLDGTDHLLAIRNGRHIVTARPRRHLADEECRRSADFPSGACAFRAPGEVTFENG
ncbi:hypothetical protein [Streptomyces cinereospinus]|uniref:DUF397 domain-containing protein n=1 Tax=Streptomyces cinereospinus TaxID=285561 RepID=A0ABV5N7K8_9ACTN